MQTDPTLITITKKAHDELLRASRMLDALRAGGVVNWEWYGESLQEFYAEEDDE